MKDLTQGSVTRHFLHMSAFMAVGMVVQTLYLLADFYRVGHLGKEAIAAVGVAGTITMIVLALTQMLGVGTTTLISHAAGRNGRPVYWMKRAKETVTRAVLSIGEDAGLRRKGDVVDVIWLGQNGDPCHPAPSRIEWRRRCSMNRKPRR